MFGVYNIYTVQPVKEEVEEEEVSPADVVTSNNDGLTQSASERTKYYEPQENSVGAASTGCTPVEVVRDDKDKVVLTASSPDGLSCSPSTFHSPLSTTNTPVIVPGTFTQKNSNEKVLD